MVYYVIFRCHVIEALRPDGFPKFFEPGFEYQAETPLSLVKQINQELARMWVGGGILIPNPDLKKDVVVGAEHLELNGFDRFAFLPKHMISFVQTVTTIKQQQPPDEPESGIQLQ